MESLKIPKLKETLRQLRNVNLRDELHGNDGVVVSAPT